MVWREAQRAIGEVMITRDGEVTDTLGVVGFVAQWASLRPWMHRMRRLLETSPPGEWEGERARLAELHTRLRKVVAASNPGLDPDADKAEDLA